MKAFDVSGSQRMKAVLGQPLNRHKYVFLLISFFFFFSGRTENISPFP